MAKKPPPKRTLTNMNEQDTEASIYKVMHAYSALALKISRLNVLSAGHRTTLETLRADMLNESEMANTNFAASEYSAANDKGTLFIAYVSYWFGFIRACNMTRLTKKRINMDKLSPLFDEAFRLLTIISEHGLDGTEAKFYEHKQLFKLGVK